MRTDLDHLPAAKQREIERVKAIIFEEFEDALALSASSLCVDACHHGIKL